MLKESSQFCPVNVPADTHVAKRCHTSITRVSRGQIKKLLDVSFALAKRAFSLSDMGLLFHELNPSFAVFAL